VSSFNAYAFIIILNATPAGRTAKNNV
jgi:hypothetical protein